MQQLEVKVPITIPEHLVLVERAEYENLVKQELTGRYYSLDDLAERVGKSRKWLYDNLLNVPERLKRIEPFTHIPQSKGDRWAFKATEMNQYLEDEFLNILRRG